jgi:hypothetical protein
MEAAMEQVRTRIQWLEIPLIFIAILALPGMVISQDVLPPEEAYEAPKKEYSPFVNDYFPTQPLFGDSHLHTSWSADAGMLGGTLNPHDRQGK